jgi:hypothetical protein
MFLPADFVFYTAQHELIPLATLHPLYLKGENSKY